MNNRCNNPNGVKYHRYGGRGISICDRWKSFDLFFLDMGEREVNQTIDRIDNDGGYQPSNCKWSTIREQNRNRKDSIRHHGENATDASIRLGGKRNLVRERLKLGWPTQDAFSIRADGSNTFTYKVFKKLVDSLI